VPGEGTRASRSRGALTARKTYPFIRYRIVPSIAPSRSILSVGPTQGHEMNLDYLGDALDHWKGSLLEFLRGEGALRDLAVDPMATDVSRWTAGDFAVFARLLRVQDDQVLRHNFPLAVRSGYFGEVRHRGDLFLDPDTGIDTGGLSPIAKYVKPADIAFLLQRPRARVLAVYQHVRAQKTSERVNACMASVAREIPDLDWCSYESGGVAMLFFARDEPNRIQAIRLAIERLLGRHADRRLRMGPTIRGGPTTRCT